MADKKIEMIKVIVKDGLSYIDGRICSYETKKIRSKIQAFADVNDTFTLPQKYTYVITKLNGFAKIVKKQKANKSNNLNSK